MSIFSVTWQVSKGQMASFPAFIASKPFDLSNPPIPQIKSKVLPHIMTRYPRIDLNKINLDQILRQHQSLDPIGVISAKIKILLIENFEFECIYCKGVLY